MRRFLYLLLLLCSYWTVAVRGDILTNLSGGFCRSWKFATNISNQMFRMMDLDGGLIPGDLNSTHNYMIAIDLSESHDLTDGESYPMTLVDSTVPILKDQALWSNQDGSRLFLYGGRGASKTQYDDGIWEYYTTDTTWHRQSVGTRPIRLAGGAYVNAPAVQAAYWIGGFQSSDTTPEITDENKIYPPGMLMLNTTTNEIRNITTPFGSTQGGGVVYLPSPNMGSLVYIGGEVVKLGTSAGTPRNMTSVWVFDIASEMWFEQEVSGDASARLEFCTVAAPDGKGGWHLYVMGGADYYTDEVVSDVVVLAVPSFKWYEAGTWSIPRMSTSCEIVGKQLLIVGGRLAHADGEGAGCYSYPVLNWDLNKRASVSTWNAAAPTYSPAADILADTAASPTPSNWAIGLEDVLLPSNSTSDSTVSTTAAAAANKQTNTAAIAGGTAAGIVVVAGLGIGIFLFLRRRRGKQHKGRRMESPESPQFFKPELAAERDPQEMDGLDKNTRGRRSMRSESISTSPQELEAPLPMQPAAELKGSETVRWG